MVRPFSRVTISAWHKDTESLGLRDERASIRSTSFTFVFLPLRCRSARVSNHKYGSAMLLQRKYKVFLLIALVSLHGSGKSFDFMQQKGI